MKRSLFFAAVLCAAAHAAADDGPIKFAAVGDVMLGSTFPDTSGGSLPPNDGAGLLDEVAPILKAADLAFGNLEGPLVDGGVSTKCGKKKTKRCYAFRVPTRYAAHLAAAGFDVMGLANNHAMDFGEEGRQSSIKALEAVGIAHSGPVGDIAYFGVRGRRVALIAFATYGHSLNLNKTEEALQIIADEAKWNDLVIVSFHGGAEGASKQRVPEGAELFYNENRGDLRAFSRAAIDAGAALVFGHGPHVVRGMEIYKDHLIAYSLGNFATYGGMSSKGPAGVTLIEVWLAPDGTFAGGKVHPVKQLHPGGPLLDPEKQVIPMLNELSRADFPETAALVAEDGTIHR